MLESSIKGRLALRESSYVHPPNMIVVPAGRKTVPVTVEWAIESDESRVIGSHDPKTANCWTVLDSSLKQVMQGVGRSARKGSRKAAAAVGRTVHGGGSPNPQQVDLELAAAKLKNGATYTLVASRHGVLAAVDFVALHPPKKKAKPKSKAKPKKRAAKKKTSTTQTAKKAVRRVAKKAASTASTAKKAVKKTAKTAKKKTAAAATAAKKVTKKAVKKTAKKATGATKTAKKKASAAASGGKEAVKKGAKKATKKATGAKKTVKKATKKATKKASAKKGAAKKGVKKAAGKKKAAVRKRRSAKKS